MVSPSTTTASIGTASTLASLIHRLGYAGASMLLLAATATGGAAFAAPADMRIAQRDLSGTAEFTYPQDHLPGKKPWTAKPFQNDPSNFQFVIIGDRTGGANAEGTFKQAIGQLNLLRPEFVINVGDTIEGYSDQKGELNSEWDEIDVSLNSLVMPFFRTPGNHDISNDTAAEVWAERYGQGYYYFVYRDTLFIVLNSEDTPRKAPEGIGDKMDLYNRLQTEDPQRAKKMLKEFMTNEAVVASLSKPVDFSDEQVDFVENALKRHSDVRWTFLFLHEPAWDNASESFKAIQTLLKNRRHTFFAGHLHYYDYDLINGHEHITMGPAGASFHKEGPGNVDHITWVTMTDEGPEFANIALKGVFDRKGLDPAMFGAYDRTGY
ncbi:metallophosphoesterase [Synechococcus sp. BSF8S]|nr:metallophosphoesterase [Synechococcus sp. BSF8S]